MQFIKETSQKSIFETKFTSSGTIVIGLLTVALIILAQRVLYDVARLFTGDSIGSFGYFDNPQAIWAHVFVIFPILFITLVLNYLFGENKQRHAIFLLPYFITTIIVTAQLIFQLGYYFATHHNDFQFYSVMSLLVVTLSVAIYAIQQKYGTENPQRSEQSALIACIVILFLFSLLILKAGVPVL